MGVLAIPLGWFVCLTFFIKKNRPGVGWITLVISTSKGCRVYYTSLCENDFPIVTCALVLGSLASNVHRSGRFSPNKTNQETAQNSTFPPHDKTVSTRHLAATMPRGVIPNNDTFKVISRVVEPLLSALSLVANSVIIIAFARCRKLRSNTTGSGYNLLLVFLAIADLLYVLVTIPVAAMVHYGYPKNFYGCLILTSSTRIPILLTVSTLLIIVVDRFVSIRWPFHHEQYCSRPRIIKSVILLWVVDVIVSLLPLAGFNKGWNSADLCSFRRIVDLPFRMYTTFFSLILAPLFVICVIYGYIFYVIMKISKTVAAGPVSNDAENRSQTFAAAKKCGVIILAFVVCIIPLDVNTVFEIYLGFRCSACMRILSWGLLFHGFVCPIIYLYQNRLLRTVVLLTLRCRRVNEHQLEVDGS